MSVSIKAEELQQLLTPALQRLVERHPDAYLVRNDVGNLSIMLNCEFGGSTGNYMLAGNYSGFIDFMSGEVIILDDGGEWHDIMDMQ